MDGLKLATRRFLESKGSERERIFCLEIYPALQDMINGVFLSLKIYSLSQDDIKDVRQEIYSKVLSRVTDKGITGIRSFKNYYFITIKNITIDYLRSHNRDKEFNEEIQNLIYNTRLNGKLKRTNEPLQEDNL